MFPLFSCRPGSRVLFICADRATVNALTLTVLLFHLQFSKHVSVSFSFADPSVILDAKTRRRALVHGRAFKFSRVGADFPFPFPGADVCVQRLQALLKCFHFPGVQALRARSHPLENLRKWVCASGCCLTGA